MRDRAGVTVVEVLISIIVLTSGILGIASASANMIRMLSRADVATTATLYTQERLEQIRATPCAGMTSGSETRVGLYQLTWTITAPGAGRSRQVVIITAYPVGTATRQDTVQTAFACS